MPGISDHHFTYTKLDMKVHRHQQPPPHPYLMVSQTCRLGGIPAGYGPKDKKDLAPNNDLTVEEMWNSLKITVTETTLVGENQENHG